MNKEGRLSFERFCAGLKISILRHEAERNKVDKRNKVNNASLTRLREISPLSLAFSRHVRMLMHEAQSGNHRTCCKRVVPRFRELAPRSQRESGGGTTLLPSPVLMILAWCFVHAAWLAM